MFLKNVWYVAAWDHEVSRTLRRTKILGEYIVLYRAEDGRPIALEDACPHRKAPLSLGRLKGDIIECGYHGLQFDCTGQCLRVPGQGEIPPKLGVQSYPVAEKWGLIWIWMGDPAAANPDEIFHVEHYDDPAWGINRGAAMDFACNYLLVNDNLLDPTHVSFVHPSSFGEAGCEDTPLNITVADNGVTVWRWIHDCGVPNLYQQLVPFTGRADRLQQYEVRYPSHALIKAIFVPAGAGGPGKPMPKDGFVMDSYNFMTPVDEDNTRYYWFQTRNVLAGCEETSRWMSEGVRVAFEEDRVMLEAVHWGLTHEVRPHVGLAIDSGPTRFRRQLARKIAKEQKSDIAAE